MSMTIEERAEYILAHVFKDIPIAFRLVVIDQITQACAEARAKENARGRIILDKMIDKSFAEGFSDAIERAANIAELNIGRPAIAIEIRALKPGEE